MFVDSMERFEGRMMQKDEQHLAMIGYVLMYHFCAASSYHSSISFCLQIFPSSLCQTCLMTDSCFALALSFLLIKCTGRN